MYYSRSKEILSTFLLIFALATKIPASRAAETVEEADFTGCSSRHAPAGEAEAAGSDTDEEPDASLLTTPTTPAARAAMYPRGFSLGSAAAAHPDTPAPDAVRGFNYYEDYLGGEITEGTLTPLLGEACRKRPGSYTKSPAELLILDALVRGSNRRLFPEGSTLPAAIDALRKYYRVILPGPIRGASFPDPDVQLNLGLVATTDCTIAKSTWTGISAMLFSRPTPLAGESPELWEMRGLLFFIPRTHDPENHLQAHAFQGLTEKQD